MGKWDDESKKKEYNNLKQPFSGKTDKVSRNQLGSDYNRIKNNYEKRRKDIKKDHYSGGCFITTAVCQTLQKSDDCEELMKFRHFRDVFMQTTPEMQSEVQEYYKIAPKICSAIDNSENESSFNIYISIWENSLKLAFEALKSGKNREAYNIYKDMVIGLKRIFLREENDKSDTNY